MSKLVQYMNISITDVNGQPGWETATVQVAELIRNDKGHWVAVDGTVERIPLIYDSNLSGHYYFNDTDTTIDLGSHKETVRASLLNTLLTIQPTKVVRDNGTHYYELRPTESADLQQADGRILRTWWIWVSDDPIPEARNKKLAETMTKRVFAQYAQSKKHYGFI